MQRPSPHPQDLLKNSGMLPPEVVAVSILLVGVGALILIVGTSALRLPGLVLSVGMQAAKTLVGLIVISAGVGLYWIKPWSRNVVRCLIFVGGILVPLYGWESNIFHLSFVKTLTQLVDWEFAWTARGIVLLTSAVIFGYLSRPSIAWAFENGGEAARFKGFVCVGCGQESHELADGSCIICGGGQYAQFMTLSGVSHLRESGEI